jgi:hypothetical protein
MNSNEQQFIDLQNEETNQIYKSNLEEQEKACEEN